MKFRQPIPNGGQIASLKHRLFDKAGLDVRNVSITPGSNREATPEQIAEQINKSLDQIEAGDCELVD